MPSGEASLKAGTYSFDFPLLDAPGKPFPNVVIAMPDGWTTFKGFGVEDTARQLFVGFWNVVDVYANSCRWLGPRIHPGPTVDGLAAVLAGRPLRNATAPVAVSVGGYHGKFLEWSVPSNVNFSDCDRDPATPKVTSRAGPAQCSGTRPGTQRAQLTAINKVRVRSTASGSSTLRADA
jgi:hypothetical protein